MKKQLNNRQQQADYDLNVILILTLVPLLLFLTFKPTLFSYTNQTLVPLWLRLILLASCQFAIAGLGTSTVMLYRKESFRYFRLITKKTSSYPFSISSYSLTTYHIESSYSPDSFLSTSSINTINKRSNDTIIS